MSEATDVLRREHATILVMVEVLEDMLARHDAGHMPSVHDMPGVTRFFLRYADRLHHAKEELVLFPAILRRDPESIVILDELMDEHQRGRGMLDYLERALSHGDFGEYFTAVRGYVQFIRAHIHRENDVLLPTADTFLTAHEQAELAVRLAAVQVEYMTDEELDGYLALQTALAMQCGG